MKLLTYLRNWVVGLWAAKKIDNKTEQAKKEIAAVVEDVVDVAAAVLEEGAQRQLRGVHGTATLHRDPGGAAREGLALEHLGQVARRRGDHTHVVQALEHVRVVRAEQRLEASLRA